MTISIPNYPSILGEYFPDVRFACSGSGDIYENIVCFSNNLPAQTTLDDLKLLSVKACVKKKINESRQEWMSEYFTYDTKTWNSDEEARNNIVGVILTGVVLGNSLPVGYTYRDFTNIDHEVTFTYMVYLGIALSTFRKNVYVVSQQKKDAVDALTTISEVVSYDYTIGWPSK